MPGFIAKKLCPSLVVVEPHFDKYHQASEEVRKVLAQYDPNFCPMGLDESYLDITDYVKRENASYAAEDSHECDNEWSELPRSDWLCAEQVVQDIRTKICEATGLTASAGIAPNKMLAKVASDMNKPNGQLLVVPTKEEILRFVRELPIRKVRSAMMLSL